jgi:MFS family permease
MGPASSSSTPAVSGQGILAGVTAYHWLVVLIASAGWLFDCMDQRLFILCREAALTELMGSETARATVKKFGGYATTVMMLGWATGGIIFGIMSDRAGRVKTMIATLLVYSGFTGLSGCAQGWVDFIAYRFLVGLGVGGMFGAATTLVAESVPGSFRAVALGSLQALSATGNITGSLISYLIPPGQAEFLFGFSGWRVLFFVGILPSLLVVPMIFILREPEPWKRAREAARSGVPGKQAGSLVELLRHPVWRRHAIVGLLIGLSGMAGLWGIAFFSPELISTALANEAAAEVDRVRSVGTALQDVGAFLGMVTFTFVAARVSRRLAFLGSLLFCWVVVSYVFFSLHSKSDAYWMLPLMGFATLSVFAGYSIYFPELFPTRLRGTGVGFCYNTVRYVAAPVPALLGHLADWMGSFRYAAIAMASVYLIGVVALLWAPETKGKPLPED